MANEPTSADASTVAAQNATPTSPTPPPVAPETPPQSQSALGQTPDKPVVSAEDFRRMQSQADRNLRAAQQREAQLQQQLAQMQAQLDAMQMQNLPEDERRTYQMQQYIRNLESQQRAAQEQLRNYQIEAGARAELSEISEEFGVPVSTLYRWWQEDGKTPQQIWRMAAQEFKKAQERAGKAAAREERREANQVDTGQGKPATTLTEWESQLEAAQKAGDATTYVRLLRQRPANK